MSGFNKRGPNNQGPMTGRGMGRCANGPVAGSSNLLNLVGRGLGLKRGRKQGVGQGLCRGQGRGMSNSNYR